MTMCILEIKNEDNLNDFAGRGPIDNPGQGQGQGNVPDAPGFERNIIQSYRMVFPEDTLVGTSPRANKRIVLIDIDGDVDEFVERVTTNSDDEETGRPVGRNLQWRVLAKEGEPISTGRITQILNYFDDRPVFDEDGNQIGTEPVTDLASALPVWFGKRWSF